MKICAFLLLAGMAQLSAYAGDVDEDAVLKASTPSATAPTSVPETIGASFLASMKTRRSAIAPLSDAEQTGRTRTAPRWESPFALAIGRAAKKGIVELGVEAYSEVLIECQKEQSTVLTTPFMRSDSQQAHCFRF